MDNKIESEIISVVLFQVDDNTPAGKDYHYGIGFNGDLLYRGKEVKGDMPRFTELSKNGVLIMAPESYRGLGSTTLNEGRDIIVVSRSFKSELVQIQDGLYHYNDLDTVIDVAQEVFPGRKIVIAGGVPVYDKLIPHSHKLYTTQVKGHRTADRKIKNPLEGFREINRVENEREGIYYPFIDYINTNIPQIEAYTSRGENGY